MRKIPPFFTATLLAVMGTITAQDAVQADDAAKSDFAIFRFGKQSGHAQHRGNPNITKGSPPIKVPPEVRGEEPGAQPESPGSHRDFGS